MIVFGFLWFVFFCILFPSACFQSMHSHFSANIIETLKKVQWKTSKKERDTGHMNYEMREKKRLSGSQTVACSCLKSGCKDDRAELFLEGTDDNSKDKATSCKMATKKPFFTSRVMQHGNRLLQVSCGISVLGVFESQPRKTLDDLSCCWWHKKLASRPPRGPFQHFCDFMR